MSLGKQFQQVELGDCCEIVSGSTPSRVIDAYWNGDINWFTPKDLSKIKSKYVTDAPEKITQLGLTSCSTRLLPKKSLLLSSRAPIGHLAINAQETCTNQGFKSLIPNANLDVEYLYYAIKNIVPQLQDMGNGATFKEISKAILSKVKIPLPPLAEQQKIAAILDAADSLRKKDQQLVERYTTLSQSLFLEMFGDVETNSKNLEEKLFSEVLDLITYGLTVRPEYVNDGISLISAREIKTGIVNFETAPKISKIDFEKLSDKAKPLNNDILFSKTGSIGHCALVKTKSDFAITQNAARLTFAKSINPIYAMHYLMAPYIQQLSQSRAKGNAVKDLQLGDMKKFKFLMPTAAAQNQFAERIKLIEAQKQQAKASLQKSEALFNSLLQQAFTGELTRPPMERAA